jgi:hypothetical protein
VYFPLYRASLIAFVKQIRQSGFKGTLLSADGVSTEHSKSTDFSAFRDRESTSLMKLSRFVERKHEPKFGSCGSENGASTRNHFGF